MSLQTTVQYTGLQTYSLSKQGVLALFINTYIERIYNRDIDKLLVYIPFYSDTR